MIVVIVGCEIAFWVLLALGLLARYALRASGLSRVLLLGVPAADVVLLAASVADLRGGATAEPAHGLAAVYLGTSLVFGPQMIRWADERVAHRLHHGPPPTRPPRTGRAHAARERTQWYRHLLAYTIAAAVLALFTLLAGDPTRAKGAWTVMAPWSVILAIDFLISFSYTLSPRKN
ncbi:2TM domain-containing protein [Actinomadura atramentaria]|uniref:2TM domain-containing protein n=1 Tax=Actinomadura atramentaria TaxID=1990 RepID=UPI0003828F01|nr:2TM domain-containing protein [Actinomadura atramentaria]